MRDIIREFNAWGHTVPPHSRWWIDDDLFEILAAALFIEGRAGFDFVPTFKITWRGVVSVYRKSQYNMTRLMRPLP